MRVLYVSAQDVGGGRFNGYAVLCAQESVDGFVADMAVWRKRSTRDDVFDLRRGWMRYANAVAWRIAEPLGLDSLLGPSGAALIGHPAFDAADVVHLQVTHNGSFFSIAWLSVLSRLKPVVWTIHDMWPMTGTCQHAASCEKWLTGCGGRCPRPLGRSPLDRYSPALLWRAKQLIYTLSNCTLVVASDWMCVRVERSPLLSQFPRVQIPFGVDLAAFSPRRRDAARSELGLAEGEHAIAFRGVAQDKDNIKGMVWIERALRTLRPSRPTTLLIVDDGSAFSHLDGQFAVRDLGWLSQPALSRVLAAADVFVMPSEHESFGLMAVEAMASGTPVVAFDQTAVGEVIRPPEGGIVVPAADPVAFAGAIRRLLDDDELREFMRWSARGLAVREYDFRLYLSSHLALYEMILASRRDDSLPFQPATGRD